jgi:hypothetical protein
MATMTRTKISTTNPIIRLMFNNLSITTAIKRVDISVISAVNIEEAAIFETGSSSPVSIRTSFIFFSIIS